MAEQPKPLKQQLKELVDEGKFQQAVSMAVRCLQEEGKDKKLISLTNIAKSAIKVESANVKSVAEIQKKAVVFGTKEISSEKPMKSGDLFSLIKELSATYLVIKASEDANKPQQGQGGQS